MPGKPDKQHRIRVRALDGKPRDEGALNKLKSNQLGMPHLDIVRTDIVGEFILCAVKSAQLEQVRPELAAAGLEVIEGGDTTIAATTPPSRPQPHSRRDKRTNSGHSARQTAGEPDSQRFAAKGTNASAVPKTPYGFVALPKDLTTSLPVWHDGTCSKGRLSGEIRFELKALTPLLVGWERQSLINSDAPWPVPFRKVARTECAAAVARAAEVKYTDATDDDEKQRTKKQQQVVKDRREYIERCQGHIVDVQVQSAGWSVDKKHTVCPLRAPWGKRPVIIPGDSLKGLLRHELGALLGAPMERVAERTYSYRPNAMYPLRSENRLLVPRLARVLPGHVEMKPLSDDHQARVPTRLELFPATLQYNKQTQRLDYRFDQPGGSAYRGGQGAGTKLNSKRRVHTSLAILRQAQTEERVVPDAAQDGYLATVRHLANLDCAFHEV